MAVLAKALLPRGFVACGGHRARVHRPAAALDKVALGLLDGHARHCLAGEGEGPETPETQTDELMGAVGRLLAR